MRIENSLFRKNIFYDVSSYIITFSLFKIFYAYIISNGITQERDTTKIIKSMQQVYIQEGADAIYRTLMNIERNQAL